VDLALGIILSVVAFVTAAAVIALFVWAAIKDGEDARAIRARARLTRLRRQR
jgi:hypothetical protein